MQKKKKKHSLILPNMKKNYRLFLKWSLVKSKAPLLFKANSSFHHLKPSIFDLVFFDLQLGVMYGFCNGQFVGN